MIRFGTPPPARPRAEAAHGARAAAQSVGADARRPCARRDGRGRGRDRFALDGYPRRGHHLEREQAAAADGGVAAPPRRRAGGGSARGLERDPPQPRRSRRPEPPDRQLSVPRPDRRREDGALPRAGRGALRYTIIIKKFLQYSHFSYGIKYLC